MLYPNHWPSMALIPVNKCLGASKCLFVLCMHTIKTFLYYYRSFEFVLIYTLILHVYSIYNEKIMQKSNRFDHVTILAHIYKYIYVPKRSRGQNGWNFTWYFVLYHYGTTILVRKIYIANKWPENVYIIVIMTGGE